MIKKKYPPLWYSSYDYYPEFAIIPMMDTKVLIEAFKNVEKKKNRKYKGL